MPIFDEVIGLISAIVVVILFFFFILPQIASALGQRSDFIYLIGGLLIVVFVAAIIGFLWQLGGGYGGRR